MHMRFLSRGFKNLQWYGMTDENLVTMPVTRFFLCPKFQFSSFPPFSGEIPLRYRIAAGLCLPCRSRQTLDNTGLLCYNDTN